MTEARKLARRKAKKLSAKPQPKVSFNLTPYKCYGTAGHAMINKVLISKRNAQRFEDHMDYAR